MVLHIIFFSKIRDAFSEDFPCSIKIKKIVLLYVYAADRYLLTIMIDRTCKENYIHKEQQKKELHTFKGLHFRLWEDKKINYMKHC